jgi:hypothetical protein
VRFLAAPAQHPIFLEYQSVPSTNIAVFKGKEIRRTLHNKEWWFVLEDVVCALTYSVDPGAYWRKLKERLKEEEGEVVTNCHGLKLLAPDGKLRETDCAILRRHPPHHPIHPFPHVPRRNH